MSKLERKTPSVSNQRLGESRQLSRLQETKSWASLLNKYKAVSKEIQSLFSTIKKYGNAEKKESLALLMNSTHRSFSHFRVKSIARTLLCKLHNLFSSLQESQVTMDLWFIGNAIKEHFEAFDQYYYALSLLKPDSSTCYLTTRMKQFYALYKARSQPSKQFINKLLRRVDTALINCKLSSEAEFEERFLKERQHFATKSSAFSKRFEPIGVPSNATQKTNSSKGKGSTVTLADRKEVPLSNIDKIPSKERFSTSEQQASSKTAFHSNEPRIVLDGVNQKVDLSYVAPLQNKGSDRSSVLSKNKSSLKRKRESALDQALQLKCSQEIKSKKQKMAEPNRS